jgi:hypothetical protein
MGAAEVGGNRKRSFPLGFFFHGLIKALFGWFFKMVENIFEQTIFNFLRVRQNRDFYYLINQSSYCLTRFTEWF